MTETVTNIWRHPLKSHGREALDKVTMIAGQTMPGDRVWAVAHEASEADASEWAPCNNFTRGSKAPQLMAIDARLDDASGQLTLSHPDRPDLSFDPDVAGDLSRFLDWEKPLVPANRAASARIIRVPGRGMTDTDFPSVSLCNWSSHRAVEEAIGYDLSPLRWRGNIWFDLGQPWVENDLMGQTIQIGGAVFVIREPVVRCLATTANPKTGERDADTLKTLKENWGHQNFSVYAEVLTGGDIQLGDSVKVL
ncbi:MOSC domain-containing protein [Pseudophaeobacter leonis]|uniref:MOSC domain-containing protein n=1 Tax=Pseudophaeobacter leonis TaxID=1144477 RepID=UPI0009F593F6|nr:MOSC N-terminal beta barrel domain-containing protein [Pseudophaeobacter leonis]